MAFTMKDDDDDDDRNFG